MTHRNLRVLALAVAAFVLGATAQAIEYERGSVVSTNWSRMEMDIKDTKGRQATWKVARGCEVKFEDQTDKFPNPSLNDLKAPMYIHFTFEDKDGTRTIQSINVKEVGFDAARGGPGVQQQAVVTNVDPNVGQIEVLFTTGGRTTFAVDPKGELAAIKKGDNVTLLIDTRDGHEVVTKITKNK